MWQELKHFEGVSDIFWHLKILFYRVAGSATAFSYCGFDVCQCWWGSLSLVNPTLFYEKTNLVNPDESITQDFFSFLKYIYNTWISFVMKKN